MQRRKFGLLDTIVSPAVALVGNLLMAYVVYFIARVAYLLENYGAFSEGLSLSHLCTIFGGGLVFDTSAILYTNMLYIVMMLFPLSFKETAVYHRICKWLFVVVNTLALIINLCDSVYFPYTLRRTTTSVFREFDNENNLGGIFFTELLRHWYFVLLVAIVAFLLWKLYLTPRTFSRQYQTLKQRLVFAGVMLASLAVATPLVIGGCRGGLGTGVRPITINNANQYVNSPKE